MAMARSINYARQPTRSALRVGVFKGLSLGIALVPSMLVGCQRSDEPRPAAPRDSTVLPLGSSAASGAPRAPVARSDPPPATPLKVDVPVTAMGTEVRF